MSAVMSILITPGNNTGWGLGTKAMFGGAQQRSDAHPVAVRAHYRAAWGSRNGRRRGGTRVRPPTRRAAIRARRRIRRVLAARRARALIRSGRRRRGGVIPRSRFSGQRRRFFGRRGRRGGDGGDDDMDTSPAVSLPALPSTSAATASTAVVPALPSSSAVVPAGGPMRLRRAAAIRGRNLIRNWTGILRRT